MQAANFILIDAAVTGSTIDDGKAINSHFVSLYRGREEEDIENVGPYLFTFSAGDLFSSWVFNHVWNVRNGIIIKTEASLEECLLHFQQYLVTKDDHGKDQYFRFYDPRVLKVFLPACDREQAAGFFGPVEKFIIAADTGEEALEYGLQMGVLQQKKITLSQARVEQAGS